MNWIKYAVAGPLLMLGLVLGLAAPAAAEETVRSDPAQDVIDRENVPPYTEVVAPGDRKRDIRSIRTKYADEKLQVTIELRELGADYTNATRILVPSGDSYLVLNEDEPGTSEDTVEIYFFDADARAGAGAFRGGPPLECEGLKAVRIPETERIRTVVPRTCFGSPGTVRTGAMMHTFLPNGHARMDDARRNADVAATNYLLMRVGSSVSHN